MKCPKGHSALNFLVDITGFYCTICDKVYAYGQIKGDNNNG